MNKFIFVALALPIVAVANGQLDDAEVISRSRNCKVVQGPVLVSSPATKMCFYARQCEVDPQRRIVGAYVAPSDQTCAKDPTQVPNSVGVLFDLSYNEPKISLQSETVETGLACRYVRAPKSTFSPLPRDEWDEFCSAPVACEGTDGSQRSIFLACPYERKMPYKDGERFICPSISKCYATRFETKAPNNPSTAGRRSRNTTIEASTGISRTPQLKHKAGSTR